MAFSCSFELCVKSVEAFEAFREDFLITQALLGPTLEYLFNAKSFDSVKLVVFDVCIVNELGYSKHSFIANAEVFDQSLECAAIPMMTELHLKHVVGNRLREVCGCVREDEFGARIDKLMDQPSRTYAINFRSWPGEPCFASIILYLKPRSHMDHAPTTRD